MRQNIDDFNRGAAFILARLYRAFPIPAFKRLGDGAERVQHGTGEAPADSSDCKSDSTGAGCKPALPGALREMAVSDRPNQEWLALINRRSPPRGLRLSG
jgi:hypothetical protein